MAELTGKTVSELPTLSSLSDSDLFAVSSSSSSKKVSWATIAAKVIALAKSVEDIPSGANIDAYTSEGVYRVASATIAESLAGVPPTTTAGFRLFVYVQSASYIWQIAIGNHVSTPIYKRRYDGTISTWSSWTTLLSDSILPISIANGGHGGTDKTAGLLNLGAFDLGLGTQISAGADLDDYKTAGSYYVASAGVAAEVTNTPTTGSGYKLLVMYLNNPSYVIQIAITYNGYILRRVYIATGWSSWYRITQEAV